MTSWTAACQASLSFIISQSLLKFISIESVKLSKYYPLLPTSPFAFCLSQHQGFFPMSQLFPSGGQSIGASATASVLPMNIQDWFLLGLTGLISLLSKGLSRVFSSTIVRKHQFFSVQPSWWSSEHIHIWLLEKPQIWQDGPLRAKQCLYFFICCLGLS